MSQEGMDRGWAEMTLAERLRTIRSEVRVGWFKSAREKWLSQLAGEPGILEIVMEIKSAEQHRDRAIRLLQEMEDKANE